MINVSFLSCRKWTGRPPAFVTESRDAFSSVIPLSTGRTGQIGLILPLPGASLRTVMTDSSIPDMMAEARRGQWTDQQLAAKAVELAEFILKQSNAGMRGKEKRESGKARLRAKASAEGNDGKIRRGDKRKQKVRKRAKKEESVQNQDKEPPRRGASSHSQRQTIPQKTRLHKHPAAQHAKTATQP